MVVIKRYFIVDFIPCEFDRDWTDGEDCGEEFKSD